MMEVLGTSHNTNHRARLYWQCRRGMLELDSLLNGFLDVCYETLTPTEHEVMERLLGFPDPVLLEWLMGRIVPLDKDIVNLVERIRNAASPDT